MAFSHYLASSFVIFAVILTSTVPFVVSETTVAATSVTAWRTLRPPRPTRATTSTTTTTAATTTAVRFPVVSTELGAFLGGYDFALAMMNVGTRTRLIRVDATTQWPSDWLRSLMGQCDRTTSLREELHPVTHNWDTTDPVTQRRIEIHTIIRQHAPKIGFLTVVDRYMIRMDPAVLAREGANALDVGWLRAKRWDLWAFAQTGENVGVPGEVTMRSRPANFEVHIDIKKARNRRATDPPQAPASGPPPPSLQPITVTPNTTWCELYERDICQLPGPYNCPTS